MVVALKNSMITPPIYVPCVQLEQRKNVSFFLFHSLTLSLCLSISSHGLHLLKLKLSLVFLSQWPNGFLFASALLSSVFLSVTLSGRMAFPFFSFFSLQRVSHTCSAFALNQKLTLEHFSLRSQTSPCFGHYPRNGMPTLEA